MLHIPFVCQRLAALVRNAALVFHNGAAGEPGCSTSLSLPPVSCPAAPGFLRYQCLFLFIGCFKERYLPALSPARSDKQPPCAAELCSARAAVLRGGGLPALALLARSAGKRQKSVVVTSSHSKLLSVCLAANCLAIFTCDFAKRLTPCTASLRDGSAGQHVTNHRRTARHGPSQPHLARSCQH